MILHDTLIDLLKSAARSGKGITFINAPDLEDFLSYRDLFDQASCCLGHLTEAGLRPGDALILQAGDNRMFLTLFWACLLGRITPVPLTLAETDEYRLKLLKVCHVLSNPWIVTDEPVAEAFQSYLIKHGHEDARRRITARTLLTAASLSKPGKAHGTVESATTETRAYIQFSSGSTGDPKGVLLTHGNLVANIGAFLEAKRTTSEDSYLSWLPLTHDMGLIGWHLNPLAAGVDQYLFTPGTFVRNPAIWFDKISEHKATIVSSPNFGLSHFLKSAGISPEKTWDLSHVRIMVTGSEHISHSLLAAFQDRLAPFGFRPEMVMPGYGLAEATLAVAVSPLGERFLTHYLDISALGIGERIKDLPETDPGSAAYVDEGRLLNGFQVRITDDDSNTLSENTVGHILLKGSSVSSGYVNNPLATRQTFSGDGWLKTGDLGFLRRGRITITGRSKELIIIGGTNHYPHDLERVAGTAGGINGRTLAACGVIDRETATEELILFVSHKKDLPEFIPVIPEIKETIARNFHLPVSRVIPIASIPRTTSGKLQRIKLAERYRKGAFDPVIRELNQLMHGRLETISLKELNQEERIEAVTRFILSQAQSIMGSTLIAPERSLVSQGFDSLMGIELRNVMELSLGITVPISCFRRDDSIRTVASILLEHAQIPDAVEVEPEKQPAEASLLEQLIDMDRMSDDEIREMLATLNRPL